MNNATELSSLIERLEGGRVLCVGDLILDRYVEGSVDRISPEGPIPVLSIKREVAMPGGAGNVLLNLCSLGVAVNLVAALGEGLLVKLLFLHNVVAVHKTKVAALVLRPHQRWAHQEPALVANELVP